MRGQSWPVALLLAAALLLAGVAGELDGFEDADQDTGVDEAEDGFGMEAATKVKAAAMEALKQEKQQAQTQPGGGDEVSSAGGPARDGKNQAETLGAKMRKAAAGKSQGLDLQNLELKNYIMEMGMVLFLAAYILAFFIGKRKNEAMALDWARAFCLPGELMERNFSIMGPGNAVDTGEIMIKESSNMFTFYASGRRYCKSMLATLDLRRRQDLMSTIVGLVLPKDDMLEIEVQMSDVSMPPVIFALGHSKVIKPMFKERKDLSTYTKLTNLRDRVPKIASQMVCYTESKEVGGDIISLALDDIITEDTWATAGKYLQSIVVTTEAPEGPNTKVIQARIKIPQSGRMKDLSDVLASVVSVIDAVGSYKMSPEAKKRAEDRRRKVQEEAFNTKEKRDQRQELANKKKADKAAAEKERLAKLAPEARAKAQEKQEKLNQRRTAKSRMKMMKM